MPPLARFLPALILGTGALILARVHRQHDAPLRASLASLPDSMLGHRSFDISLSPEEERVAGVSQYRFRAFVRDSLVRLSVYVGYYESQTQGKTIHSPKNCLPGGGWEPVSAGTASVAAGADRYQVNRYVIAKDGAMALVYYWYQGRGRVASDEFRVKWDLLRDKAVAGRSEEALVRIVVPVTPGRETEADGLATGAASRVIPQLFAILPQFP